MSKARELITVTDIVRLTLKQAPEARNSDNTLYILVLKALGLQRGIDISSMSVLSFFMRMKELGIPSIETVGRCRRKIVELHPELAGNSTVEGHRMVNETVFRDYARKVNV
jgi:hypothetical protein